jgi:hypothetical protein
MDRPLGLESVSGKTVQMVIGLGPGGGYDLWGRTVARHIGRHLSLLDPRRCRLKNWTPPRR